MKAPTLYRRMRRAAEAGLMRALLALLGRMPVDRASDLGGWIGRSIGPGLGVTRRAARNLRACFSEKSEAEIAAIITGMWDNLGRTACEYAHLKDFRFYTPDSRISVHGLAHIDQAVAQGKGAIFVSGHFANWELLTAGLVQRGLPVMAVYRAASNPLADEIITELRRDLGMRHQAPKGPAGARMLLNWMNARNYVAMLSDQKMNDGVEAIFLGRPAMCPPAAAQLARRFGCPVIFASIRRTRGSHFIIEVEEPFYVPRSGDRAGDIMAGVTGINRRLEAFIRRYPEQWLWLHRRWPERD